MHLRNGWLGNRPQEIAKTDPHTWGKNTDAVPGGAAEMKDLHNTVEGWLRKQVKAERQSGEKEALGQRHRSSRGLWFRVFKRIMAHFGISRTVLVLLSISSRHYVGITRPFGGMTPLCSFPCQVYSGDKSSQEESWSTLASQHLIMLATEPFGERTSVCSIPGQPLSRGTAVWQHGLP